MYVSFTLVSTPVLLGVDSKQPLGADSKQPLGADSYDLSFVLLLFNFLLEIVWLFYIKYPPYYLKEHKQIFK